MERWMRSFLINKNLFLYYWLKKRIGKREAFWVANTIEKVILIFGREQVGWRSRKVF
jgi:tRNA C32,U32 (ribose-2'-O)-methylase TrmJ